MRQSFDDITRVIVGITGGSGSGKTTFSNMLAAHLGPNAVLLSHDDYYKRLPHMTKQEAEAYDFDSPDALDTDLFVEHLRMLKSGIPIDAPSYDFATYSRTVNARRVEPAPVILAEGMLLMCYPELLDLLDLTIYMDADSDVRALRRLVRDCNERGTDVERAVRMYLGTCKPAHERYVEPFKDKADIVIDDSMQRESLEAVMQRIDSLLA